MVRRAAPPMVKLNQTILIQNEWYKILRTEEDSDDDDDDDDGDECCLLDRTEL